MSELTIPKALNRLHDLHKLSGDESDQLDEDESDPVGLALADGYRMSVLGSGNPISV